MYAAHQSIFPRRAFKIHKTQQIHKKTIRTQTQQSYIQENTDRTI